MAEDEGRWAGRLSPDRVGLSELGWGHWSVLLGLREATEKHRSRGIGGKWKNLLYVLVIRIFRSADGVLGVWKRDESGITPTIFYSVSFTAPTVIIS